MKTKIRKQMAGITLPPALPWVLLAAAAVCVLAVPFLGLSQYVMRVVIMAGIYTMLALSLNLVTGLMGQISMGHAAFYAIGAYTAALCTLRLGMNFLAGTLFATLMAGAFGFLLGLPTMRLSGAYLVITTMGFAEVVKIVLLNWDSVTNGALGVQNIPRPVLFGFEFTVLNGGLYYLMLVYLAVVALVFLAVKRSKMGRALTAIRDDELAGTLMGVNTAGYKIAAFALSAALAGFAGALYAYMIRYIDPNTFSNDMSMMILSIVILGGRGSLVGMFMGSGLLVSFPEVLRFMENYRFIVYGLLLVLMMRFRPQGLLGGHSKRPYRLPKGVKLPGGASLPGDEAARGEVA